MSKYLLSNMSKLEQAVSSFEDWVEKIPQYVAKRIKPHAPRIASMVENIEIDAPLTSVFCFICLCVQLLSSILGREFVFRYFAVPTWAQFPLNSPLSYFRVVSQTMGHSSWEHLSGNVTHLLLVAPACEREFGMYNMMRIIAWTAVASSLTHMILGPSNSVQLGASGVVFMLILLNSLVEVRLGSIPLTFLIQVSLWCYKEIALQLFSSDGVSHMAHLTGAVVGTVAGYYLHEQKVRDKVKTIGQKWFKKSK